MAMVENIERVGNNFLLNIQVATTTAPGKVIAGLIFVSAFFADSLYLFIALFAMIIIDFFFGLSQSDYDLIHAAKTTAESRNWTVNGLTYSL